MTDESTGQDNGYLGQTTDIVAAYLGNNTVEAGDIAGIIQTVHGCFVTLATGLAAAQQTLVPAVPIKKSVTATGEQTLHRLLEGFRAQLDAHRDTGIKR